jgi:two-component system cell cycle response regulator
MTRPWILVADDSALVRAVVAENLAHEGCDVLEAVDGVEALTLARTRAVDVIMLDVEMPGLDGYQVLAALQADDELRDVPVLFLTGRSFGEEAAAALSSGAYDYLRKPFEPVELVARVRSAVRAKRLQDELKRRNAELDHLTRIDTLTGLFNRRHLQNQLAVLSSAAQRHGWPLGVLLLDVDHFKRVNDTHGHAMGDAVLCAVAEVLRREPRAEDVVGRWGGEEFLVLMPGAAREQACVLGDRLRAAVAEVRVTVGASTLRVTVSVGCASGDGSDPERQLRQADEALYAAKDAGRNRLVAAPG